MLDVAHAARLPGDLAHQEQPATAGLAVVGLQGGRAVGVVVLDGHPQPVGADGDLHGEHRRQQRRVPDGVRDELRDDQQQPLDQIVGDRHALPVQQVPYGVPRLRDRGLDGGGGEPPDTLVRQWIRQLLTEGLVRAARWAWAGPAPVVLHRPVATLALDCHHTSSVGNGQVRVVELNTSRLVSSVSDRWRMTRSVVGPLLSR
ncbi:putative Regulator protein [Streptomyces viridochromogenes Tue57]|uniref:Putative Regulator protein n=1 Tax=Streptomyces viridochromogenes Tue57 TaxID=1160705 RepID=L8PPT9_STRVR|nr:putative Regulator protein [Streptomyces viridochromogenes Tue57]